MAYCARDILPSYYSAFNLRLSYSLCSGFDLRLQPRRVLTFRFEPQPLRGVRLLQSTSARSSVPSIHELQIFGPAGEIQPQPAWRLNAHPFPWDVGLAFDHNPVTRWSAWQPVAAGAWMEAQFGKEEIVSSVRLETSTDQESVPWTLEEKTAAGRWAPLRASTEVTLAPTVPDIRRRATQELKRHHIEYLPFRDLEWRTRFSAVGIDLLLLPVLHHLRRQQCAAAAKVCLQLLPSSVDETSCPVIEFVEV